VSNKYPLALHTLSSHGQAMTRVKLSDRAIIVFLLGFHDLILLRCFLIWSFYCLQLIEIARKANWNWLKWVGLSKKWFGLGQIGRLAIGCQLAANLPIKPNWHFLVQLAPIRRLARAKNWMTWPAYLEAYPIWPIGRLAADPIVTAWKKVTKNWFDIVHFLLLTMHSCNTTGNHAPDTRKKN